LYIFTRLTRCVAGFVDLRSGRYQFENPGYGMRAIGYHGTSVERAERILAHGFEISRNDYDWLGDGAYFFQDAPARAAEWARQGFGAELAVVGAEVDLSDCLDLLDPNWHGVVREGYTTFLNDLRADGRSAPRQTAGAHRLDREVLNLTATLLAERGMHIRTVRATFVEGVPLYEHSALWSRAHVQIAVREPSALVRLWRVE
jgi:hypothetical protein